MNRQYKPVSYKSSGVNIAEAERVKKEIKDVLEPTDPRVLNRIGAFSSLFRLEFPRISDPVLVLKMEEPGSKQLLAINRGNYKSIAYDTVNHLINDVMVMGATPIAVLDAIVCGKLKPNIVEGLVNSLAEACREQQCTLVGGEISEQPGVLDKDRYIITASACGIVSEQMIIDGRNVTADHSIVAVSSNGFHTNGYSLLRKLLEQHPSLAEEKIGDVSFIEKMLAPHLCYGLGLRKVFEIDGISGLAHITGGGIRNNLCRILPNSVDAVINLEKIQTLDVFSFIKKRACLDNKEMLNVFNCGVGLICIVSRTEVDTLIDIWEKTGFYAYIIGHTQNGFGNVIFNGDIQW